MTADPRDPAYLDEASARGELTWVFDRCRGCRQCVDLCATFPALFDRIDQRALGDDAGAGRLTPADQDEIVDTCMLCDRCVGVCPPAPDGSDAPVHVPNAVVRARAVAHLTSHSSLRGRRTTALVGRPVRLAGLTRRLPLALRVARSSPGGPARHVAAAVTGISAVRVLPPVARERFSTWFRRRAAASPDTNPAPPGRRVTLLPTCLVEHHEPAIGRDLVGVYEHNGITCHLTDAGCCGAAALDAGDDRHFRVLARQTTEMLAPAAAAGEDIVVPQPRCRQVIAEQYPRFVDHPAVDDVAACVVGTAEPLLALHDSGPDGLDINVSGHVPARITLHVPCHGRGAPAAAEQRLLELFGARVIPVVECSGSGGAWGVRRGHEEMSLAQAAVLGRAVIAAGGDAIVGGCHMADMVIAEQTDRSAAHPIQLLARAYGIAER